MFVPPRYALVFALLVLLGLGVACTGGGKQATTAPAVPDTLTSLNRLIQENPTTAVLYFSRSQVHFGLGDTSAALNDARQAIALDSTNADYRYLLGYLDYLLGRDADALIQLQAAIKLGTSNPEVYHQLGNVWLLKGDANKALVQYEKALSMDNSLAIFHFRRAYALHKLGRTAAAIEGAEVALERDSLDTRSLSFLFDIYISKPYQPARALAFNQRLMRADSLNSLAWFNQGYYYQTIYQAEPNKSTNDAVRNLKSATNSYTRAIELNPTYAEAFYNRGYAYFLAKKFGQAAADFQEVTRLNPRDRRPYFMLGSMYEFSRDYSKAAIFYQKALRVDSTFADAAKALKEVRARMQ
jgi:tetratricopeptide (TPR) repeat protein